MTELRVLFSHDSFTASLHMQAHRGRILYLSCFKPLCVWQLDNIYFVFMPPGGSRNMRMIPSVSLHAVISSEWVDHVRISLGSCLLTVISQWRPWLVDWRNYLFYNWSYAGFGGVRKAIRPNVTMPLNLLFGGFSFRHVQTLINWILWSTGRTDLKQFWWWWCW